ncbi:MAG: TGS domain-containing protein, partial [Actinomycetota bacterium]|nr:TGS domain-containing protein [Actinomycetota bacterium]
MSSDVVVVLPDGSERTLTAGATGSDLATDLGGRAAREALIAVADGVELDLDAPLPQRSEVSLVFPSSDEGLEVLRHSTAHVLAQAVLSLYPGATFSIGPPIEDGFYYDFDLPGGDTFSEDDLDRIERKMKEIIGRKQPFLRAE